jgi:hypothetical protein
MRGDRYDLMGGLSMCFTPSLLVDFACRSAADDGPGPVGGPWPQSLLQVDRAVARTGFSAGWGVPFAPPVHRPTTKV